LKIQYKIFLSILILNMMTSPMRAEETLRLATTTSLYESGLLDVIVPVFEKQYDCKLHIISVGTGKAIQLGRNGDVDVLLVHARKAEEAFVHDGYGVRRTEIMHNDFILLGPSADPADVRSAPDVTEAMRRMHRTEALFVSRGDDSGTHKKEKFLWSEAGRIPDGSWYMETGQGMSATLRIADEKDAYCLVDRSIFLFNRDKIRLVLLFQGGVELVNPYSVIAVNPEKFTHVNHRLASLFIQWLSAPDCQSLISSYRIGNSRAFFTTSDP